MELIKDAKERCQIEFIINNFSQTPTQLFTEPHPQHPFVEQAKRTQVKGFMVAFIGKRSPINLFDYLSLLKAHSIDVSLITDSRILCYDRYCTSRPPSTHVHTLK